MGHNVNKLLITLYAILTASGLILLKLGTQGGLISMSEAGISWHFNIVAILGIVAYGLSFILYTILISKNDLGLVVASSASLVYVIVFFASFILFNEEFTLLKIIGICFILFGLLLLNSPSRSSINKE